MSRSLKKGPYVDEKLYRKVEKLNAENRHAPMRTWARAARISVRCQVDGWKILLPVIYL